MKKMKKIKNKINNSKNKKRINVGNKGKSFEREIANSIKHIFPEVRRHLEYQDAEAYGVDLINTGPYKIQCKRLKQYASVSTIREIICEEFLGDIPVLVTKPDHGRIMAVLPFEALVALMASYGR